MSLDGSILLILLHAYGYRYHFYTIPSGEKTVLKKRPNSIFVSFQLGPQRVHTVRTMGGNTKYRALRLDHGNFSWGSEGMHFIIFACLTFLLCLKKGGSCIG